MKKKAASTAKKSKKTGTRKTKSAPAAVMKKKSSPRRITLSELNRRAKQKMGNGIIEFVNYRNLLPEKEMKAKLGKVQREMYNKKYGAYKRAVNRRASPSYTQQPLYKRVYSTLFPATAFLENGVSSRYRGTVIPTGVYKPPQHHKWVV